jgi:adenylate cyclase
MQNSMEQFKEIMKQTNVEMAYELSRMPIGKFHCSKIFSVSKSRTEDPKRNDILDDDMDEEEVTNNSFDKISSVFLSFSQRSWELSYLHEPDIMLEYSIMMGFVVFLSIVGIQILNDQYVKVVK